MSHPRLSPEQKTQVLRGLLGLLVFGLLFGLLSVLFHEELTTFTTWVFTHLGLPSVFLLLFLADALASPIPTGSVILWLTLHHYPQDAVSLVALTGVISALSGHAAFAGGRLLARSRKKYAKCWLLQPLFILQERHAPRVERAAPLSVALFGLSPIPFAVICWAAGLLQLPFRTVALPCFIRVVRYFTLYFALISSFELFS